MTTVRLTPVGNGASASVLGKLRNSKYLRYDGCRKWLFVALVLVSTIPILGLTIWTAESAVDREFATVKEKHLIVASNLAMALSRYVTDIKNIVNLYADTIASGNDASNIGSAIGTLDLAYIATIDGKNRIISQAEIKPRTVILPNPKLLETLWEIARSAGGDIAFSSIEMFKGEPHFFVVKMLSDNRLVLAPLSPHYVRKVQKSIAFGDRGHSMIVDHRGRVVAHPNAQWQASSKDASKLSVVKKMISGGTGVTTFYSPPMRADMIAGYTFVPETGWGVMVPQPTSELIESARKVQFVGFVVAVVVIAFAIGASWWLSLFLTRPIRAVADAAYRISNGDLTARADLTSSYVPIELKDLGKAFNQMAEDLKFKTDALTQDITELNMAQVQALRNAALRDYLTGMYNRRYFFDLALPIFENAKRQNSDLMVAMMDIDHFKSVNDSYGHGVGDEVLVIVAGLLEKVIRSTDIIARFGGEEFCLIATAMPPEAAKKYLDSVRDNISKLVFSEKSLSITVSIGATNNLTFSLDKMISDADKMLYHAKESGRNKVVTA